MQDIILQTKNLKKSYIDSKSKNKMQILKGIDFELKNGEVVAIIGPSGCGKSTFLRCLNGLESIDSGEIIFEGQRLDSKSNWRHIRQKIGMVFQSYELFPHLSVIENITLAPIKILKQSKDVARQKAIEWLKIVGLESKIDSYPNDLSGGQKQRVAIVRSLCMSPKIMLFDEVTASLDPEMVKEVLEVIRTLANNGMSMIIVTHQMRFAQAISDRSVFFDNGLIAESGDSKEFFSNPQNPRTRQFLNIFDFE
ncbi:ATP-binding cassette domain-containing protein [Helicobacter saguini]|uniref:ATP-binding cassette domain-containing protein n=1 Tax=Helicobacter saguini TaxID=1548018 RepID=A0A347VTK5_9HELI|nr:amino acid ABC transporter ATP-binding protein [Helicobacter saguini]MWV62056.1 ATP-binding cassette domain-containing protein [Helicobacter saguini]MWV67270.1 ATP-binding cassette domain-containing protein [Helicobacter saguini]MWV69623.1 ATP-binding cassette domain-containing protein [Helicobacter saguini]MWV70826.1 ATP-binding cassette domain-containing protein [Helicobacter saguini]TLD94333.1 amino acid ABC transporter ATP-binding protein [Helicobacter saguini]